MPLKVVTRKGKKAYYIRGTVRGKSVYESTETTDPDQAEGYRIKREREIWERSVHGSRAVVTFAAAVASYLEDSPRSNTTKRLAAPLLNHFRHVELDKIDQEAVKGAYKKILRDGLEAKPATKIRSVLGPLSAILEHAATMKWCDHPAFIKPQVPRSRTPFLKPSEVNTLIDNAAPHIKPLLTFLAGTGSRMSEALELKWSNVDLRGARCVTWQKQDTERQVDLPPRVVAALAALPHREGHVFRPVLYRRPKGRDRGKTIGESYRIGEETSGQIRTAWATACRKAEIGGHWHNWTDKRGREQKKWKADISPHVLRHSFATWHYCLHRDLLRLRDDLGWSTISMVERYAKKMPDVYRPEIEAWLAGGPTEIRKEA